MKAASVLNLKERAQVFAENTLAVLVDHENRLQRMQAECSALHYYANRAEFNLQRLNIQAFGRPDLIEEISYTVPGFDLVENPMGGKK